MKGSRSSSPWMRPDGEKTGGTGQSTTRAIFQYRSCLHLWNPSFRLKWIWKPVYATMGLGIDRCKQSDAPPSSAVYMLVEQVIPSFHVCAEWFRISTLWRHKDGK